jgi:hypothetical protein
MPVKPVTGSREEDLVPETEAMYQASGYPADPVGCKTLKDQNKT